MSMHDSDVQVVKASTQAYQNATIREVAYDIERY